MQTASESHGQVFCHYCVLQQQQYSTTISTCRHMEITHEIVVEAVLNKAKKGVVSGVICANNVLCASFLALVVAMKRSTVNLRLFRDYMDIMAHTGYLKRHQRDTKPAANKVVHTLLSAAGLAHGNTM